MDFNPYAPPKANVENQKPTANGPAAATAEPAAPPFC